VTPNWPKFEPKSSTYTGVEGMYFVLIISECFVYFLHAVMIRDFMQNVSWSDRDFLIVDTPPGTSDEHISVIQNLRAYNPDGAVLVTTPQVCYGNSVCFLSFVLYELYLLVVMDLIKHKCLVWSQSPCYGFSISVLSFTNKTVYGTSQLGYWFVAYEKMSIDLIQTGIWAL